MWIIIPQDRLAAVMIKLQCLQFFSYIHSVFIYLRTFFSLLFYLKPSVLVLNLKHNYVNINYFPGKHEIIPRQLDELLEYSGMFIKQNSQPEDNIAFCIVCGDFNMDNLSPGKEF